MRTVFAKTLVKLAEKDKDIVLLCGDFGYGIFNEFKKMYPDRFFNLGSCEQSIIGIAAGMASSGLKPYIYSMTPYLIEKPFEHIKIDIDEQNLNVKLIGFADYPTQGPTHRALNAKGLMSLLKNTVSYFPNNSMETESALLESYAHGKPTFISLKSNNKHDSEKEVQP